MLLEYDWVFSCSTYIFDLTLAAKEIGKSAEVGDRTNSIILLFADPN